MPFAISFCRKKTEQKSILSQYAIGGRKKTTDFICNTCNNTLGEKWDSELAKQLNWFSLAVGISRERGAPPRQIVQTVNGEQYWFQNDGSYTTTKSSYHEEIKENIVKISLTAKTMDEAKQRLKDISRKYPNFDAEKAYANLEVKTNYLDSPIQVQIAFGGPLAGRSVVKTAIAFASVCGIANSECDKAIKYLLNETLKDPPFGFAYTSDMIQNRPNDKIFHCVFLNTDPKTGLLWSYIEYFGFFRMAVILSNNYKGEFKNEIYAIDPINGINADIKINPEINVDELELIFLGNGYDNNVYMKAVDYPLSIIIKRDSDRALEQAVKDGFQYAAKKIGINYGEVIPKESGKEFASLMMHQNITAHYSLG